MNKVKLLVGGIASFVLAGGISVASVTASAKPVAPPKAYQHIFVIMMENEGSQNIIGNPDTPYITHLAHTYGYEDNYYGVTHPSLPNYIAAFTGNTWYSNSDDPTQTFNHANLLDQLNAHHLSWKGYMESLPSPGWTGYWYPDNEPAGTSPDKMPPNALYGIKHDPFMLLTDVRNQPAEAKRTVVPLAQLTTDLQTGHVPNFAWISPNMIDDMHGQPPGPGATAPYTNMTALYKAGDQFIQTWVQKIMDSSTWKQGNSLIIITWDEGTYPGSNNPPADKLATYSAAGPDAPTVPAAQLDINWPGGVYGGGKVPFIFIDTHQKKHTVIDTWADHYNLLRTIEANWKLGYLGMAGDEQQVKTLDVFQNN